MKVLLVGNSHGQALWPRLTPFLTARGHEVVSFARPGWSEQRYDQDPTFWVGLAASRPQGVVVELGSNNRLAASAYRQMLLRFVDRFSRAGPLGLWWVGPPTAIEPETAAYHERAAEVQAAVLPSLVGAAWFDSRPVTREDHREDRVHFTPTGYSRWARALEPWLAKPISTLQIRT